MPALPLPTLIAHADWSCSERKRWMATATLEAGVRYRAGAPQQVEDSPGLLARLRAQAGASGTVLAGFDFPIGLPAAYAQKAGIDNFLVFLSRPGRGKWADFYRVAGQPDEISLYRPFYPNRPGAARLEHLWRGLELDSPDQLRRACEGAHPGRRAAAPLFWTMGGQQVGKAALSGWKEVLAPALKENPAYVRVWPFSGRLAELLQPGLTVLAETYPAEFYLHLGIEFQKPRGAQKSGKRVPRDRAERGARLIRWAAGRGVVLEPELQARLSDGFGPRPEGEDPFDAAVGLFGMLNLFLSGTGPAEPAGAGIRTVEGWILGQPRSTDAV